MNSSEDLRRMSEYQRFREYMRRTYGPGPWDPGRCQPDDGWLAWCSTYNIDPITGKPRKPPAREGQEEATKRAAS